MITPSLKQAQLSYYYERRAELIRELDSYCEPEYPWSLYTEIEILNEQINDIIYGKNKQIQLLKEEIRRLKKCL